MKSIIVAAPRSLSEEFVSRLQPTLPVALTSGGSIIVVEMHLSRVYIAEAPSVLLEYESDDLERITCRISDPVFYVVEFTDTCLAREVLLLIADDSSLLVDNDHGLVLAGNEFVRRLRKRNDWNWCTVTN